MIGKITKGSRTGSIGAYLHGPGRANEHLYKVDGKYQSGGQVIASNLLVVGDTDPKRWAAQMRQPLALRDKPVKQPIWQVSLALPPGEKLSPRQWADAAQTFVEKLGVENNPWVAVYHGASGGGNDHIHIVLNRVDFEGNLWAAKHDYRQVQKAATHLEQKYGLSQAPRTRNEQSPKRTPKQAVHQGQRKKVEEVTHLRGVKRRAAMSNAYPASAIHTRKTVGDLIAEKVNEAREVQRRTARVDPKNRGKGFSR